MMTTIPGTREAASKPAMAFNMASGSGRNKREELKHPQLLWIYRVFYQQESDRI
jgi:hypothetical protein